MRGKGIIVDPSALPLRITPAYAGKSEGVVNGDRVA